MKIFNDPIESKLSTFGIAKSSPSKKSIHWTIVSRIALGFFVLMLVIYLVGGFSVQVPEPADIMDTLSDAASNGSLVPFDYSTAYRAVLGINIEGDWGVLDGFRLFLNGILWIVEGLGIMSISIYYAAGFMFNLFVLFIPAP